MIDDIKTKEELRQFIEMVVRTPPWPSSEKFLNEYVKNYGTEVPKPQIKIKYTDDQFGKASKKLGLPKYVYFGEDAGFDIPVVLDEDSRKHGLTIYPGDRILLHSGMMMEFPVGYWARIIHRSSTERRYRLRVIEGVIDDYRGEIITQVHNMNTFPIVVEHGQKIAQMILCNVCPFEIVEANELRPSKRSGNGFGSSGV